MGLVTLDRRIKPAPWNFDPARVDPAWRWAWHDTVAAFPLWEGGGGKLADISATRAFPATLSIVSDLSWPADPRGRTLWIDDVSGTYAEAANARNMLGLASGTTLTVTWYGRILTAPSGYRAIASLHSNIDQEAGVFAIYSASPGFFPAGSSTVLVVDIPWVANVINAELTFNTHRDELWTVSRRGSFWNVWRDGIQIASNTVAAAFNATNAHTLRLGGWLGPFATPIDTRYSYFLVSKRGWSFAEHTALAADPFGPFRPARRVVVRVTAADTSLAAAVSCSATAAAALSTAIPLAAAVAAAGTVAAALTTAIPLAGAVTGTAVGTGDLTTAIPLAASVSGAATITGALTTEIPLAAAVAGAATVAADLMTAIALAASATGSATTAGALTTAIPLTGAITGIATTTGDLEVGGAIALDAAVSAAVTVAGALTTEIPLAGALTGAGTITGELATQILLAGGLTATASSAADLQTAIALAAAVQAAATVSGELATAIPLLASVIVTAIATADLTAAIPLTVVAESLIMVLGRTKAIRVPGHPEIVVLGRTRTIRPDR